MTKYMPARPVNIIILPGLVLLLLLVISSCSDNSTNNDSNAPDISIVYPVNGATVSGIVNITASATSKGSVVKVEFYADNQLLCTDTTSPWGCTWTDVDTTQHTIYARAFDDEGNSGTSDVITVNKPDQINPESPLWAVSPEAVNGNIGVGEDFTIEIWIDYNGTEPQWLGGSFSFHLYSPDHSIDNIIHRDGGGLFMGGSVDPIDSMFYYFDFGVFVNDNGWDGYLSDSISFALMGSNGIPASKPGQAYILLHMRVDQPGMLCIDSCTKSDDSNWDWLFPDEFGPVSFAGPYCWTIKNSLTTEGEKQDFIIDPEDSQIISRE